MYTSTESLKVTLIALIMVCAAGVSAQTQTITLTPDANLDPDAGPCTEISAGTTLTFNRSATCDQDILINTNALPPVELLQSSAATVTYTFAEEGSYVVFCGAPAPNDVAIQAICVNVGPAAPVNPIPTMGEWAIIMSILLLLIVGVVFLRQSTKQALQV